MNPRWVLEMKDTIAQILSNGEIEYLEYDFEGRNKRRNARPMALGIAMDNLLLLKGVFDKYDITFWLIGKTCLGAVRDGNIMEDDTDTDIGVFMRDRDKIISVIPELQKLGLKPIRTKYPDDILSLMRNDEYIDICFFQKGRDELGKKYWFYQDKRFYGNHFDRFDAINFLGEEFLIPINVEKLLETHYGENWRTFVGNLPQRKPHSFAILKRIYKKMYRSIASARSKNSP